MADTTHTPGPWELYGDYMPENRLVIIANVDGEYVDGVANCSYDFIATCQDEYGEHKAEAFANARLIAAAPELLAALRGLLNLEPPLLSAKEKKTYAIARAAFAKATGRAA